VEIVAFPRTFAMYRDNLENEPSNITRQFICDYYPDGKYILKEIQPIQAPFIFEQAVEELFETFDEEQFQEWQNKLEPLDTRCAMCEGFGRLKNLHNAGSYVCPSCNGTGISQESNPNQESEA